MSVDFLPDGRTPAPKRITPESELERLRAERSDLEVLAETDPLSRADDPATWRTRDADRRGQLAELEVRIRRLERWGQLVIDHEESIIEYERVARAVQGRNKYVLEHLTFTDQTTFSHRSGTATTDVRDWWQALGALARSLTTDIETEPARAALTRELDQWFLLRSAVAAAIIMESGRGQLEWPEHAEKLGLPDPLPKWLSLGARRGDR